MMVIAQPSKDSAIRGALEGAGVIFVDENGQGPRVGIRKKWPSNPSLAFMATLGYTFIKDLLTYTFRPRK
jgi:hypothetical protein